MSNEPISPAILRGIPAFDGFSDDECRQLFKAATQRHYEAGEYVLEEGRTSQQLWILLEGACEVLKASTGNAPPVLLAVLEPFASFGEMSFFHQASHSASVRAQGKVQLLCLERTRFEELAGRDSQIACRLAMNTIAILAQRMRLMSDRVAEMVVGNSRTQISDLARLHEKLFDSWQL